MSPSEVTTILRQLHDWLKGGTQWAPTRGAEAVEAAVEMIERMDGALESLLIRCDRLGQFQEAADASAISELLDRIEAAEKDIALKERIIDSLGSELNAVAKEREELRAKIEAMEQQEPVDLNYIELMNSAQKIVESYVYFRRFIASTPLENDIAVWMADFVFAQLDAKGEKK